MDSALKARHAEEHRLLHETVNAARMYERCIANRHAMFKDAVKAKQAGEDIAPIRKEFDRKTIDIGQAKKVLKAHLGQLIHSDERILVDGILYIVSPSGELMRVVMADLKDWGKAKTRPKKSPTEPTP